MVYTVQTGIHAKSILVHTMSWDLDLSVERLTSKGIIHAMVYIAMFLVKYRMLYTCILVNV